MTQEIEPQEHSGNSLDEARIWAKAGNGGNGVASFRREKFVPFGGPDGGDGGRGGSVYLKATPGTSTLLAFSRRRHFKADSGGHGSGARKHGKAGEDLTIPVPPGTVVRTGDGMEADLLHPGDAVLVARGGRGGLGNTHFATSTNRAPRLAQKGEPGEERWISLEVKTIAQAALIGEPNAGKSSLLAATSAAQPKVADYPFTTLHPNLGVVETDNLSEQVFVLADIPGLIAGAHTGIGLGHRFLRHVERAPILVHVVDASRPDTVETYWTVRNELEAYNPNLIQKTEIVAANKMDLPGAREGYAALVKALPDRRVIATSTVTHAGIDSLVAAVGEILATQAPAPEEQQPQARVYRFTPERDDTFTVEVREGEFYVHGQQVERLVAMTDLQSDAGIEHLQQRLERMGVFEALEHAGVEVGDNVFVGAWETEWGV